MRIKSGISFVLDCNVALLPLTFIYERAKSFVRTTCSLFPAFLHHPPMNPFFSLCGIGRFGDDMGIPFHPGEQTNDSIE